jgi:hypothetical protein
MAKHKRKHNRRSKIASKIGRQIRKQKAIDKLPNMFKSITNKGLHNLSKQQLTVKEEALLSLGLKFIPLPQPSTDIELDKSMEAFTRSIAIKLHFLDAENTSYDKTLHVKNNTFNPEIKDPTINSYINTIKNKLQAEKLLHPIDSCTIKLPRMIQQTINKLRNNTDIIICSADKNLGICIVDRLWYENEALRQLTNETLYERLPTLPPVNQIIAQIRLLLGEYNMLYEYDKNNKKIFSKYHNKFVEWSVGNDNKTVKILPTAKFYLTVKVHKPPPHKGRPIIASKNCITYYISKFLDDKLQAVMKAYRGYLANTNKLLIDINNINTNNNIQLDNNTTLYSSDISDMYPSIILHKGLTCLRNAINKYNHEHPYSQLKTNFLVDLTSYVLRNNIFQFGKNTYWKQLLGTAMGTPVAVVFSCIYIGELECTLFHNFMDSNRLSYIYYCRYLDDILALHYNNGNATILHNIFNSIEPSIQLKITHQGKHVEFMDLQVSILTTEMNTLQLSTSIYQKPANNYQYIPPSSNHRKSVLKNTILQEFKRYRLKCSNDMDYNNLKELYTQRLIARGYKENYINSLAITTPDRNTLLQNIIQPTIKSSSDTNPLIFITTNTPRQQKINMKNILTVPPHISDSTIGQRLFKKRRNNSDVILCYKKTKTIRQLLTRSLYDYELQPQLQLQQQHQQ